MQSSKRLSFGSEQKKIYSLLEIGLICLALFSASWSFFVLLDLTPMVVSRQVAILLTLLNLGFALLLLLAIILKLAPLLRARWRERQRDSLHWQIISLFSLVATLPALAVAIVAAITLHFGLDRWFDKNTTEIVNSSIKMANVYAEETLQRLYDAAYTMSLTLDNYSFFAHHRKKYQQFLTLQTGAHKLKGAFILYQNGSIAAQSHLGAESEIPIPPKILISKASLDQSFLFQPGAHDYFGVIRKLRYIPNAYLYVARNVDKTVLDALRLTELNTNLYKDLQDTRLPIQFAFATLYVCLFLVMWLCAISVGRKIADKILRPVWQLVEAADGVASGNLSVIVPITKQDGEVAHLSKAFNYMVYELQNRHKALVSARDQIDKRRRFTEMVLAGVTAGVVGVDNDGAITIINPSIESMFHVSFEEVYGKSLSALHHEIEQFFLSYKNEDSLHIYKQLIIKEKEEERVYVVQMTREEEGQKSYSYVITIDDITNLVAAQRFAAWGEIARRIAHEIKNPLTPIQLSAERIRRRYRTVKLEDRDIFDQCINTIICQVEDIGRMVDEFSSFARMPKAKLTYSDLREALREACFLAEVIANDIFIEQNFGDKCLMGNFDKRLLTQAFINLIQNAAQALEGLVFPQGQQGHILVSAYSDSKANRDRLIVDIIDNGKGWPAGQRQQLFEPYMTTREKGTGLGLAIVQKIVEDHKGTLELLDAPQNFHNGQGAMVRICLPVTQSI